MATSSVLASVGIFVLALAMGCAANTHPTAAEYEAPSEMSLVSPANVPVVASPVCTPGTRRDCKIFEYKNGTWWCPVSYQICKRNGFGWRKCGDHTEEPDAAPPEPTESDSDVDDDVVPVVR